MLILTLPVLTACGNKDIFKLGKYSITEKEYTYLMGMFKKQILVNEAKNAGATFDFTDEDLSREIQSGVTLGKYIDYKYRASFEQSVLSLLYSQLLFDEYDLSLSLEDEAYIKLAVNEIVNTFGEDKLKEYGFDRKTLLSVYEKQSKENKVRAYLLGENNEKVTEEEIESYYLKNYLRYKIIVINTLYKTHTDSAGEKSMVFLSDAEKERQEMLVVELKELLVNQNKNYKYEILKDDLGLTYDQLWEKYSDDKTYPDGGYGPSSPSEEELANNKLLSAAYHSEVGGIKTIVAEKHFTSGATVNGENGTITINPGDYFEYGTVFVKRLPLDSKPYEDPENSSFFPIGGIKAAVANELYFKKLMEHEASSALKMKISEKGASITFYTVKANELDYYFLYGEDE